MTDSSSGYIHMRVPGRYSTYSSWILIKFTSEVRWNWAGWGSRMVPLSTFALRYVSHCGSSLTVRLVIIMWNNRHSQYYIFRRLSSCDTANELSLHCMTINDSWPGHVVQWTSVSEGRQGTEVPCEGWEECQWSCEGDPEEVGLGEEEEEDGFKVPIIMWVVLFWIRSS